MGERGGGGPVSIRAGAPKRDGWLFKEVNEPGSGPAACTSRWGYGRGGRTWERLLFQGELYRGYIRAM